MVHQRHRQSLYLNFVLLAQLSQSLRYRLFNLKFFLLYSLNLLQESVTHVLDLFCVVFVDNVKLFLNLNIDVLHFLVNSLGQSADHDI
jgi:hypothetical protein